MKGLAMKGLAMKPGALWPGLDPYQASAGGTRDDTRAWRLASGYHRLLLGGAPMACPSEGRRLDRSRGIRSLSAGRPARGPSPGATKVARWQVLARGDRRSLVVSRKDPTARLDNASTDGRHGDDRLRPSRWYSPGPRGRPRPRASSADITATEPASVPKDGSPSGDAERWLSGRSRPRPGTRCGTSTREGDVGDRVVTAVPERAAVMELESLARRAPSPLFVLVAASASVPLVHGPLHRGRDLACRGGGLALRERLPRRLGPGEAPGFEPLELLGDGLLDDRGQVAVGHGGAHEGPQSLELVVKLGGSGELDLVAAWGEGLDHRGPGPGEAGSSAASGGRTSTPPRPLVGRSSSSRAPTPSGRSSSSSAATPSGRSSGSVRGDSVRTEFGLARADSVRTQSVIDRSTSSGPQAERRRLGVRAESERAGDVVPSRLSGSFRITAGASGRGEISATSSSISRFDRWTARSRRASRFSRVRCGASFAMAVRCSRPSASRVRRRGCSREARAAAIRR